MKIRTGFVSNSSASSFILTGAEKDVIAQIKRMAEQNDDEHQNEVCARNLATLLTDDEKAEHFLGGRAGIAFHSINYDTYILCIKPEKNKYELHIATCNNTDWDLIMKIKESHEEGSDEYCTLQGNVHDVERIYYWISEENKLRSAEHWLWESSLYRPQCKNCNETDRMTQEMWFDDNLVARCTRCDQPLNGVKKEKTRKVHKPDDDIIGGIF